MFATENNTVAIEQLTVLVCYTVIIMEHIFAVETLQISHSRQPVQQCSDQDGRNSNALLTALVFLTQW